MSYDKIIEESFENIIKLSTKLSDYDSNFLIKNIRIIANYVNSMDAKIASISARNNKIPESIYDDALSFYMSIASFHGYNDLELNNYKFKDFCCWFYENGIDNASYVAERISKQIITAFSDSFNLFKFTYDREPESYNELRNFLFTWENVIDTKLEDDIKKLEIEIKKITDEN